MQKEGRWISAYRMQVLIFLAEDIPVSKLEAPVSLDGMAHYIVGMPRRLPKPTF